MTWVLIGGLTWAVLACGVALVVARTIRLGAEHSTAAWAIDVDGSTPRAEAPRPGTPRGAGLPSPRRPRGSRPAGIPWRDEQRVPSAIGSASEGHVERHGELRPQPQRQRLRALQPPGVEEGDLVHPPRQRDDP
jgi:hypothetical protein